MSTIEELLGRYLSLRARSESEVRAYIALKRKKYAVSDDFVESLISKYKRVGYIDDQKFSEVVTHSLVSNKSKGRRVVALRLKRAGVDEETIQETLRSIPEEDSRMAMEKRLKKFERKLAALDPKARHFKAYTILATSGFSSSEIRTFLDGWMENR